MGAGKSVVGRSLARRLGRGFVDSDAEVERLEGRTIAEIFETDGEAAFRAREREVIAAHRERSEVVALGGGAIAQPGVAHRLADSGTVVYLSAPVETLLQRLGDCRSRPLLRDLDPPERASRLSELLAERGPAYRTASLTVDTRGASIAEVVDRIVDGLDARVRVAS